MNRLADQASPYLLQHKDNPVEWWPWGEAAFAEAHRTGRPVLLSIGYAACHWCHVMAHESFEDADVARVMNQLFVNIKVDREERPDVDQVYMSALMALGEQGGWPLTMFLTPDKEPFWGGTYFPKTARYGRPGFAGLLAQISDVFRNDPDRVARNASAILDHLRDFARRSGEGGPERPRLDIAEAVLARMDLVSGGVAGAPKFPNVPVLELLWRAGLTSGDPRFSDATLVALRGMCRGGMFDHLGGGFARYSTDEVWLAPHFEKMLYDNAQLLDLLALVSTTHPEPEFEASAAATVAWLMREMRLPGGAFASSLDADSDGREGAFYVWDAREVEAALGERAAAFSAAYDVRPHGNWEETNILNRLAQAPSRVLEGPDFTQERETLLASRGARNRPGLDDKVLADWNGLMITALARAGVTFGRPEWIAVARASFGFVTETLGARGDLHHSWRQGTLGPHALASDYASLAQAALALYEAEPDAELLEQARRWLATLVADFRDQTAPRLAMTRAGHDLPLTPAPVHDDAIPNSNALFLEAEARYRALTGDEAFATFADEVASDIGSLASAQPIGFAASLNAQALRDNMVEIVTIGPDTARFERALARLPSNFAVTQRVRDASALPEKHLARLAPLRPEDTVALVCGGGRCSPPQTSPEAMLETALAMMRET